MQEFLQVLGFVFSYYALVFSENQLVRQGHCPTLSRGYKSSLNCTSNKSICSQDSECIVKEKCCFDGCGFTCVMPDTTPILKAGECPRLQPIFAGSCNITCNIDEDCPDVQKCCSNGCGHECFNPGGFVMNSFVPTNETQETGLINRGGNATLKINLALALPEKRSENDGTLFQSGNLKKSRENLKEQLRASNESAYSLYIPFLNSKFSNAFFLNNPDYSQLNSVITGSQITDGPLSLNSNNSQLNPISILLPQLSRKPISNTDFEFSTDLPISSTEQPPNATETHHFLYRVPLKKIKNNIVKPKHTLITGSTFDQTLSDRSDNRSVPSFIFSNSNKSSNEFEVSPEFFPGTDQDVRTEFKFGNESYFLNAAIENTVNFLSTLNNVSISEQNKPGHCPTKILGNTVTCAEMCTSDRNCSNTLKCCSNGCGHECIEPVAEFEKDGECPILEPGKIGVCIHLCSSDNNCTGSKKCCSNGCGRQCMNLQENIHKPGICPKTNQPSKSNKKFCFELCENDSDCVENLKCCGEKCNKKCVIPEVNIIVKPGLCPPTQVGVLGACMEMCSNDSECYGGQKCCSNGCGHLCRQPIEVKENAGTCPIPQDKVHSACFDQCFSDEDCGKVKKCCNNGCAKECFSPHLEASSRDLLPVTKNKMLSERLRGEKSGFCYPVNQTKEARQCATLCTNDQQCNGTLKCCPSGCGFECQKASKVPLKDGICPRIPQDYNGTCFDFCRSDDDCPGIKKCCSNGCGRVCHSPDQKFKKEGQCPMVVQLKYSPCYNFCQSDEDCVSNKVCCTEGCSSICKEPDAPKFKIGECPMIGPAKSGICPDQCAIDQNCVGALKCCLNECGSHNCRNPAVSWH